MISLPNEIIAEIINALDKQDHPNQYGLRKHQDVRNLRLVCKILADLGARKLFEQISIASIPESTEKFFNIAKHQIYRKCVKRIYFDHFLLFNYDFEDWENECIEHPNGVDPNAFPPEPTYPDTDDDDERDLWHEDMRKWEEKYLPKQFYTKVQRVAAFSTYQNELSLLDGYARDDYRCRRLQEALAQLSSLQEINLPNELYKWRPRDMSEPVTVGNLVMRLPYVNGRRRSTGVSGISEPRHQALILQALGHNDIQIKTFIVSALCWSALDRAFSAVPHGMELPPAAFATLKRIEMSFDEPWYLADVGKKDYREEMLSSLLRQARDLEDLSLRFSDEVDNDIDWRVGKEKPTPPRWEQIVRNDSFPRLRKLRLQSVDMTEEHVADFMRRHSFTLKDLYLTNIFLLQGTWDLTFRRLKRTLHLEKVQFEGIFGVHDHGPSEFDLKFHLPMENFLVLHTQDNRKGLWEINLGTKESLNTILVRHFLEEENDADPLKYWGHGVLPEGMFWEIFK